VSFKGILQINRTFRGRRMQNKKKSEVGETSGETRVELRAYILGGSDSETVVARTAPFSEAMGWDKEQVRRISGRKWCLVL
jgi:hypothetical protein